MTPSDESFGPISPRKSTEGFPLFGSPLRRVGSAEQAPEFNPDEIPVEEEQEVPPEESCV